MKVEAIPHPQELAETLKGVRVLSVATVATSLVRQSPLMWDVWKSFDADVTFASGIDGLKGRLSKWGTHLEIPYSRSPYRALRPRSWRDTRSLLKMKWDYVQFQSPIAGAIGRINLPRRREFPAVYVAHGFHFHRDGAVLPNFLYRTVEEILSGRVDAVVVVSAEDFDVAKRGPIGRRTRVFRLPGGGVHVDDFYESEPERLFPDECLVVLFCGELSTTKNPLMAIEAVLQARRRAKDVRVVLVGTGALRSQLDRYLGRDDAAEWIKYIPSSDNIPALMRGADVILSTSSREGLPRVLVEGLAAGVPIVSVANRGSRELLANEMGRLVPQEDLMGLVNALVSFKRDQFPSREEMRQRAELYSSTRVAAAYTAVLHEVML
jgi:glycosyltransferase involved in cell wall biosynthesis